jgi:hypothetical protein
MHLVEGCHIAALQIVRSPGLDLAQLGVAKDFPGWSGIQRRDLGYTVVFGAAASWKMPRCFRDVSEN